MITPVIGERYRDTARQLSNVIDFDRFRATIAHDAAREETLMLVILQKAQRLGATLAHIEQARTAGTHQLKAGRSLAYAITCAEQHLRAQKATHGEPHGQ